MIEYASLTWSNALFGVEQFHFRAAAFERPQDRLTRWAGRAHFDRYLPFCPAAEWRIAKPVDPADRHMARRQQLFGAHNYLFFIHIKPVT